MYITRQGRFSGIKDIKYYDEGRLPNCDEIKDMKDYWHAADENGQKNARTCRQLTIALQEEFCNTQ